MIIVVMSIEIKNSNNHTVDAPGCKTHSVRPEFLPWRLFDTKFIQHRTHYLSQCILATLVILVVLLVLDTVTQTVLISALGASTFICFTMPHVKSSGPRYLIGGYIIGTITGGFISLAAGTIDINTITIETSQIIFGAIATGLAIFCMVITDTEHPPAAALALGYVLNEWNPLTIVVILTGIFLISIIKEALKKHLINLL